MIEIIETLFLLLVCHALADFTFQTEIMAKLKNRNADMDRMCRWLLEQDLPKKERIIRIPDGQKYQLTWYYWLSAHALIQGGLVYIFFGNIWIALVETIAHFSIDYLKCANKTNIHIDQGLHISLRIIYTFILVM